MKRIFFLALLGWLPVSCRDASFDKAVRLAVERQMQTYPRSTLKDLYKNFFQDRFGPGHLVADTAAAGRYLREELASYEHTEGPAAEPTGWEGNFYRANLSLVKTGRVPYPVYFDAFIRSVQGIVPPTTAEWKEEWARIEAIIRSMCLGLPAYEAERTEIEERLNRGEAAGHHSEGFEAAYSPHYRFIGKEIYEKEIAPLLAR